MNQLHFCAPGYPLAQQGVQCCLTFSRSCLVSLDMIRSFRSKSLRRFAERGDASKLSVQNPDRIRRILARLDAAMKPEDMDLPGFRFHGLKGRNKGRYAVDASGNWRITFGWLDGDAVDVDLEDYH
ncbi:type II toxin-antitoxin system RelE/ParE family toxin [Pseudorhodoplanes sp.]|uniref:type II toxin-antitoxin system RelE/ParE family toxin n=1 Tax=Pseudorhodoplanes sp. TaxID=1934341 RepID=UPI003D10D640